MKNKLNLFIMIIIFILKGCSSYTNKTETTKTIEKIEQQAKYNQKNPFAKGSILDKNNRAFGTQPSPSKDRNKHWWPTEPQQ